MLVTIHGHLWNRSQNLSKVGVSSQVDGVRLYLTSAGSKARPVERSVHCASVILSLVDLRTVVTTASHLELMCSCDLKVGIGRVVSFTPSMPVADAVGSVMPRA